MNKISKIIAGLSVVAAIVIAILGAQSAQANPSQFVPFVQTQSATSSPVALVLNATSTLNYDAYAAGTPQATDQATFLLQSTASSTASVLTVSFQYSRDGSDWYDDSYNIATSTPNVNATVGRTYTIAALTTNRTGHAIKIDTPTRYVRAVIVSTAATSSIYAEIVPVREKGE